MKYILGYTLLIIIAFLSCTKEAEMQPKQFTYLIAKECENVEDGTQFNGEILNMGVDSITKFGFVFDYKEPTIQNSETLLLDKPHGKGEFSYIVDYGLSKNVDYEVRAFAQTNTNLVYSNTINFTSNGSKWQPWNLMFTIEGSSYYGNFGMTCKELGYLLNSYSGFYCFNSDNGTFIEKAALPKDENSGALYAYFSVGNSIYVINNLKSDLYKYETLTDNWIKDGVRIFTPNFDSGTYGFAIDNTGYFITDGIFYAYNTLTKKWRKLEMPATAKNIRNAITVNNNAYIFTDWNKIWKFNETDGWSNAGYCEGNSIDKLITFAIGDNIYYGVDGDPNVGKFKLTFWQYSTTKRKTLKVDKIPDLMEGYPQFMFSDSYNPYFGYYEYPYLTKLWGFNESKFKIEN